ncbi:MAG: hypothetical protein HOM55_08830 [Proteobacteria bacterium]|nr:hypothetical protein [Pseudomonadota bacterium]
MNIEHPIAVDLDGTLCHTDTLFEGLVALLRSKPLVFLKSLTLIGDRARLKHFVFSHTQIDPQSLPWNEPLIDYLRQQKASGRSIVLVTAANEVVAQTVAKHLDLFDQVLASSEKINLKGPAKVYELCAVFGERKFVYAGDARADFSVWAHAGAAIVVGNLTPVYRSGEPVPIESRFPADQQTSSRKIFLRTYMWLVDR